MAVLTDNKTWEIEISKVIARTWVDGDFRQKLIDAPTATLKEVGLDFGDSVEVRVAEDKTTDGGFKAVRDGKMIFELLLPPKPTDLSDEQINGWFEKAASDTSTDNNNKVAMLSFCLCWMCC